MKKLLLLCLTTVLSISSFASGITVSAVSIPTTNTTEKYRMVKMDVVWSNSWRTYNYEANYDAAWIFIKYRKLTDNVWKHATLNYVNGTSDGHVKVTYSDISTPADGKGIFLYRANSSPTNFIGTATYRGIQLRWNYGVDGLADNELVEIARSSPLKWCTFRVVLFTSATDQPMEEVRITFRKEVSLPHII